MRAGQLRHRITLQTPTESTSTSTMGRTPTYADTATVWASVEPLSGNEQWRAKQAGTVVSHRIIIRYMAGVTSAMRVKFGSRYFGIESVINENERNQMLELTCKEEAA